MQIIISYENWLYQNSPNPNSSSHQMNNENAAQLSLALVENKQNLCYCFLKINKTCIIVCLHTNTTIKTFPSCSQAPYDKIRASENILSNLSPAFCAPGSEISPGQSWTSGSPSDWAVPQRGGCPGWRWRPWPCTGSGGWCRGSSSSSGSGRRGRSRSGGRRPWRGSRSPSHWCSALRWSPWREAARWCWSSPPPNNTRRETFYRLEVLVVTGGEGWYEATSGILLCW